MAVTVMELIKQLRRFPLDHEVLFDDAALAPPVLEALTDTNGTPTAVMVTNARRAARRTVARPNLTIVRNEDS